ncbi:uncharacterized protein [Triticum aestivum]|uniref:uncharacterized protein isoform X6 n=1 Tax=Triticum aestivum TaxID=4565 RepID=UPI001D019B0D|nr:uncharacterized protein LOC123061830 isoform X6 [Triticum aestivum]
MPALLLLLLAVLLLFAAANGYPPTCGNATCGGLTIAYPFWLNSSSASNCGYRGLGLACEGNTTLILPAQSHHRYRVSGIDYDTHSVFLVDDVEAEALNTASCPHLHFNFTIDAGSALQLTQSDSNITFFYNCKRNASWPSAVELTGCPDYNGSSYAFAGDGYTDEASEYGCEAAVVAPVLDAHKKAMMEAPPAARYVEVLKGGFELNYSPHSEQCGACERSGGWCGYRHNQTHGGVGFACFCDGGPTADQCGSNKKKNVTIAVVNMIFIKKIRCGGRCRRCIACCCCHGLSVHSQEKAEEGGELVFEAPQVQVQRLGRDPDALQGRRHGVRQLPGHGQPVQLRGARGGHRFLQREQRARRRRLRHRLQRLPWGRAGGGGEAAVQQQLPARGAVRERGGDPGPAAAPEPGHVLRVHLQGEPRAAPGLRVRPERHGGRPPARAPRGGARPAVAAPAQHRRGVRGGADLPPRHRAAHRAPRRQDQQHPPRHRLPRQGRRLRPLPPLPARRHPRLHRPPGHPRVRGPGVPPVLPADGQERRVQLRRGAGGAHLVQARRGHHPAEERDQPGRHGHQQDPEVPAGGAGGRGARLRVGPGGEEDDDHGGGAGVPVPAAERRDAPADQGGAGRAQGHPG